MIDLVNLIHGVLDLFAADPAIAALNPNYVYGPLYKSTVQTSSLALGVGLHREPEEGSFYRTVGGNSRQQVFYIWTWAKGNSQELADTAMLNLLEAVKIYLRDPDNHTLGGKMLDIAIGETDHNPGELQPGIYCSTAVFSLTATFGAALL